jgi:hypothetical protein
MPTISSPSFKTSSRNPVLREYHSLKRRGKRILKITAAARPHVSPHIEIHVDDGGPPYPVSVANFRERDRLLREAAVELPACLPIAV